ncbi:PREDICTED: uncharacterized protein LOC104815375 isoform X2 [Tarenaya hassleriana]|uniref:uncharacterized protein LOC104815375 isoform X2 n=1 Tax=Tarenaya hassleriana TaxID=28532 RepID=UPI00053C12C0|nr:PREDICTED: uncharacterized protein LOC104815375 isoform X2 [Tarenaya hassleriana]
MQTSESVTEKTTQTTEEELRRIETLKRRRQEDVNVDTDGQNPAISWLIHNPGISVHWSVAEQKSLEDLIARYFSPHDTYTDDEKVYMYAAIGRHFRDKTVRDVALRHRWMMEKRVLGDKGDSTLISSHACGTSSTFQLDANDPVWKTFARISQMQNEIDVNLRSSKPGANISLMCKVSMLISSIHGVSNGVAGQTKVTLPVPCLKEEILDTLLAFLPFNNTNEAYDPEEVDGFFRITNS